MPCFGLRIVTYVFVIEKAPKGSKQNNVILIKEQSL